MCVRYLGFILLIWFPGALHAQSAAQSCSAPRLDGGFFAPKQQTYSDGTKLSYTCVEGRKPAVKGWWATSTCHSGEWSPEPQCIDEKACLPPDIPNAKYTGSRSESINACGEPPKIPHAVIVHQEYQEVFAANSEVQYECEDGYTVEGTDTTKSIFCIYGNWTEGPTCKSSSTSGSNERTSRPQITTVDHCGANPNVPNGDVVERDQTYIKFQCNAFYTQVGLGTVVCYSDGTWSQLPICKEAFCVLDPAEHVGANFRLSGVEYLKEGEEKHMACIQQDYSSRVQCTNGQIHFTQCMETEPGAGQNGSAEVGSAGVNTTSTGSGIHPEGGGSRPGTGHGGSAGSASSSEEKETQLQITTITTCENHPVVPNGAIVEEDPMFLRYQCQGFYKRVQREWSVTATKSVTTCGNHPVVPNGDVVENNPMFLRYQCAAFYKRTGPERVECYSNGKWSETPTCKLAFCSLDTGDYSELIPVGVKYIKDGEKARFECVHQDEWWTTHYSVAHCNNGRMRRSRCCDWWDLKRDIC